MKILVISDSHGNIDNLKHVLGFAKKIKCGAVIHCGDWNNLESVNTVINFNIPLYTVLGNADISDNIKYKFKKIEIVEIDNRKIGIVHIFNNHKKDLRNLDIIFAGHYHSQSTNKHNSGGFGYYVVQPGALENSINFAIYDTTTGEVEFLHD